MRYYVLSKDGKSAVVDQMNNDEPITPWSSDSSELGRCARRMNEAYDREQHRLEALSNG